MNFPITLHFSNFPPIHLHLLFELLAYSGAFRWYQFLRKKSVDLISEEHRLWIFVGATAGGLMGSRLIGILEHPDLLIHFHWTYLITNKTILGGLLGGLIGVELTKKRLGVNSSSGDLMTFPLILGMAIGRFGCFAEGLEDGTYGIVSSLPWAINFGDGLLRHPTQLYDIFFLGGLASVLLLLEKKLVFKNGTRFKLFFISYLIYRFFIEFLKPNDFYIGVLCAIQVACLLGLCYYSYITYKNPSFFEHE